MIKCSEGGCDSTKALTSAPSLAGILYAAAVAGLTTAHHATREERNFFRKPDRSS